MGFSVWFPDTLGSHRNFPKSEWIFLTLVTSFAIVGVRTAGGGRGWGGGHLWEGVQADRSVLGHMKGKPGHRGRPGREPSWRTVVGLPAQRPPSFTKLDFSPHGSTRFPPTPAFLSPFLEQESHSTDTCSMWG